MDEEDNWGISAEYIDYVYPNETTKPQTNSGDILRSALTHSASFDASAFHVQHSKGCSKHCTALFIFKLEHKQEKNAKVLYTEVS